MNLPRILYSVFAVLGVAAVAGGLVLQFQVYGDHRDVAVASERGASGDGAGDGAGDRGGGEALAPRPELVVLAEWDRRRAAAYSSSDAEALGALYLAGSRTGASDVAALQEYADRGLRVQGMRMQVLAADVVVSGRTRLVLDVTDRLVGAVVAGGRGDPLRLPRDRADRRRVTLELVDGAWVVDEIRRVGAS